MEKRCLEWALDDLARDGQIHVVFPEQAMTVLGHVTENAVLVSRDDGWKVVLPDQGAGPSEPS